MALKHSEANCVKCPAAEVQQPVTSPNRIDIECRIMGNLAPKGLRPCCEHYSLCGTWKQHKINMERERTVAIAAAQRGNRARHTSSETTRETVRA